MQHKKTEQESKKLMSVEEYRFYAECPDITKPVRLVNDRFSAMNKLHQQLVEDIESLQEEHEVLSGVESSAVIQKLAERGKKVMQTLEEYLEKHHVEIKQVNIFSTEGIKKLFNVIKNPNQEIISSKNDFVSLIDLANEFREKLLKNLDVLKNKQKDIKNIIDDLEGALEDMRAEEKPQLVAEKKDNSIKQLDNAKLTAEVKSPLIAETKNNSSPATLFKQGELNKKDEKSMSAKKNVIS